MQLNKYPESTDAKLKLPNVNSIAFNPNEESYEAVFYTTKIYAGVMDMVKGHGHEICEFYVPKINLTFNIENDELNCFLSKRVSDNAKNITVSKSMADSLYELAVKTTEINKLLPELRKCFTQNDDIIDEPIDGHLYKTKVFDGIMDIVYQNGHIIKEIYVPEFDLTLNLDKDKVNTFQKDRREPTFDIIKLPKKIVESLVLYCKQKKTVKQYVELIKAQFVY